MNKLIVILIVLFFLNNCSFNEKSRIWNNNERKSETDKKIIKVFNKDSHPMAIMSACLSFLSAKYHNEINLLP